MDYILDKASRFTGVAQPTHSIWGFKLLDQDPVVALAKSAGFEVAEYDLPPYPLKTAGFIALRMMAFMFSTGFGSWFLYHYVAKKSVVLNYGCLGLIATTLLAWPEVTGRSGVMLLDFWRPALGFRSALLVWDIFHIRTREEVESWNIFRFFCHLWAFPKEEEEIAERTKEEGYARDPRIENLKGMPKVILEGAIMGLCLYVIPPIHLIDGMSRFAYHCYCDALGLCILMALALFGDGLLKSLGILFGVEMADMFENPLGTTNIRLFWSHWNRAIASVLHRVVFGGGRNTKSSVKSKSKKPAPKAGDKRVQNLKNRPHLDHLSETEAEGGKTDDESDGAHANGNRRNGLKPMTPVPAKGNGSAVATKDSKQQPRKRSPFLPKAVAAIATFAMSGIFHEHITRNTLGFANGENFVFFLLNGFATVGSTWFKREFPDLNAKMPTFVSVLLLHVFIFAVIPFFCSPFLRSGFFMQMDALKWELLPILPSNKRGSFIYLFGK